MQTRAAPQPSHDTDPALPLIRGLARLHEAVTLIDGSGHIVWMSDGLASLCGGSGDFAGRPFQSLLEHPEEMGDLPGRLSRAGRILDEPVLLRGRDGSAVAATVSAARMAVEPGQSPTVAILRVDSLSQEARRELAQTREALRKALEQAPDGVLIVDRSRFVTFANPSMSEMTGHAVAELVDKPLALILRAQRDVETVAVALQAEGPVRDQELELRCKDGRRIVVSLSATPIRLDDGTHAGAVVYLRDVTQRRRAIEGMTRKIGELEHYVDAVSHDLRSPLVSLLGFTRLLREDYGDRLDDKGRHFLWRIEQAGHTMEALIRDLLELSRIGKTGASSRFVDPREVLSQLHAELKPRLDSDGVVLELPEDPPLVRCDPIRLYQIFSNLVGNALDHMGRPNRPVVRVEVAADDGFHRLTVRDHGRGIDPADHERIFEVFYSQGPRRDGRRGTGIGLAIVRKIAEAEGGYAWVESDRGRGAAFHVTIPSDASE
jgi:PAS domain S-box-containing protein